MHIIISRVYICSQRDALHFKISVLVYSTTTLSLTIVGRHNLVIDISICLKFTVAFNLFRLSVHENFIISLIVIRRIELHHTQVSIDDD